MTQEMFFVAMDEELNKVEQFTIEKVKNIRLGLKFVDEGLKKSGVSLDTDGTEKVLISGLKEQVDGIGDEFLKLEKYVNLNFTGFHKILKKHDKNLPNKCKTFYVARMHSQAWVRGDYSDIVVQLSTIYSSIRGDHKAKEDDGASQSFMRSTTKYWVNTEDVSKVKYAVLRHLPVFLQKTATGETDSQLTNSVYLDNSSLELYHGRLDKTPGAIAVRLRWYGNGQPETIFVERKTHRDSWTGEISVKERFIVKEADVKSIMNGTFDKAAHRSKMLNAGKTAEDINEWELLVDEICQAINTKLLVPCMRTQYMRTAFQIPFDATVRVSLDTNLCMISERGYDLEGGARWHRDPSKPIKNTEIARFPHAVLEIKLEVKEGSQVPDWVVELQNSGMLYEVHKFSKFIHGCATLLPDEVQSVPYWIDDSSVRDSIIASGAERILTDLGDVGEGSRAGAGPGANQIYGHLLPHGTTAEATGAKASGRTSTVQIGPEGPTKFGATVPNYGIAYGADSDDEGQDDCGCWPSQACTGFNGEAAAATSIQKVEPKTFFANERTFIHWLHMGVMVAGVASGVLAFAPESEASQYYAVTLLPVALGFCVYALHTYSWRAERIRLRIPGRWDDPMGPVIIAVCLVAVLTVNFFMRLYEVVAEGEL